MWESEISQLKEENCCLREENDMLKNQIKDLKKIIRILEGELHG